jgi:UDP-N-acetylglucosamine/UDP-N-acetylgalactosamine diphosphorylase
MDDRSIDSILSALGQSHLKKGWDALTPEGKKQFVEQLKNFPPSLLKEQREFSSPKIPPDLTDWQDYSTAASKEEIAYGEKLLQEGAFACLIFAGGQGSRLGETIPKGTVPFTCVKKKSCYQLFFERIFYAGRKYRRKLQVAVMTSIRNHDKTVQFIKENNFFGLDEDQVHFFMQQDLPFLSKEGDWFLQKPGELAVGPNGNGRCLCLFQRSGLLDLFKEKGVKHLLTMPVDNPLSDPFDVGFLGFHSLSGAEASAHGVFKVSEDEKVGMLASEKGGLRVIEYSEKCGSNRFSLANTSVFCFSFPFISFLEKKENKIPYHRSLKKGRFGLEEEEKSFWKYEKFLFDVLPYAKKFAVLISPRESFFSPIKNVEGEKSPATAREDLLCLDRQKYEDLTGKKPPRGVFELSPVFYYPKDGEEALWKEGKFWDAEYIEPELL